MKSSLVLSDLGEKRIISEIVRELPLNNGTELLLNDDAQVILQKPEKPILISTDRTPTDLMALAFGVMTLFEYGRYCVVSNLSDIAAMGAFPIGFLVNIAAPPNMFVEDFKTVMNGIADALNEYKIPLLGGDTKTGNELNMVGVALGQSYNKSILTRSGVKPGDYLIISKGYLGLTPSAFWFLNRKGGFDSKLNHNEKSDLIDSLVKVEARFDEARLLSSSGMCTSCMDNTDGLYSSIVELASASHVGFNIDLTDISIHKSIKVISDISKVNPHITVLSAGADFRLIGTVSEVNAEIESFFQVIGRATDLAKVIKIKGVDDSEIESISRWNHFRGK